MLLFLLATTRSLMLSTLKSQTAIPRGFGPTAVLMGGQKPTD